MIYSETRKVLVLFALFVYGLPQLCAQDYDGSGLRMGYGYGMYTYHMSGPEIYCERRNGIAADTSQSVLEVNEKYGSMNNFHGATISYEMYPYENAKVTAEFGWTMRFKKNSFAYTYEPTPGGTPVKYEEKVKMSTNMAFFNLGYRPTGGRLKIGVGADLGFLRTKIKYSNAGGEMSKWEPWFYVMGVIKDGPQPKTPIAGYSFSASYDFSIFTLRLVHTRPVLDGSMLSSTGKYTNIPWSEKRFPITNTMVSLLLHFN